MQEVILIFNCWQPPRRSRSPPSVSPRVSQRLTHPPPLHRQCPLSGTTVTEGGNLAEGETKACVVGWSQAWPCILGHRPLRDDAGSPSCRGVPRRKRNGVPLWRCGKFGVIMVRGEGLLHPAWAGIGENISTSAFDHLLLPRRL